MNVLLVDEELPWPLDTGKRLRTYNLVQRLQKNHHITYLCYGNSDTSLQNCPNVEVITLKSQIRSQNGLSFYCSLLKNLFSFNPYIVNKHHSKIFADTVGSLVSKKKYDLVHCEWTPYTENILTLFGKIPTILSAHNVEAQIWHRYYLTEKNFFKKVYIYIQWQKLSQYESRVAKLYTEVSTVSEPDRKYFDEIYKSKKVRVVQNGVDEVYFSPTKGSVRPDSLVFTGSMDWRPNQDAVKFFIEEIFPIIKSRRKGSTFTVVGRKPPQWLIDLAIKTEGVTVTGTVDDVRPYIAQSALYVVPLRIGGGSRLKILEALSMEKIVLSTSIGAEGLNLVDGAQILLRDDPISFAETACEILKKPQEYQSLGVSGRELIMKEYTWDAISKSMEKIWKDACV